MTVSSFFMLSIRCVSFKDSPRAHKYMTEMPDELRTSCVILRWPTQWQKTNTVASKKRSRLLGIPRPCVHHYGDSHMYYIRIFWNVIIFNDTLILLCSFNFYSIVVFVAFLLPSTIATLAETGSQFQPAYRWMDAHHASSSTSIRPSDRVTARETCHAFFAIIPSSHDPNCTRFVAYVHQLQDWQNFGRDLLSSECN